MPNSILIFVFATATCLFQSGNARAEQLRPIGEIAFTANHAFTSEQLKQQLAIQEGDVVVVKQVKDKLKVEVEKLNLFYLSEGYVAIKIAPPIVTSSDGERTFRITFNLNEGRRFRVGKVSFAGEWPLTEKELLAITHLSNNPIFNYRTLQEDLQTLEKKCGPKHFPLPRTKIREADGEVDVIFELARKNP